MLTRNQIGAGVGLGILFGIGLIASMGQVIPPNGSAGGSGGGGGGLSSVTTTGAGLSGDGTAGNPLANSGVTSIVAGTNVSRSAATGAVTFNVAMTPNTAGDGQVVVSQDSGGKVSWGQPSADYKDGYVFMDDMLDCGINGVLSFGTAGTGASNANLVTVFSGNRPGICSCNPGTTTTGRCSALGSLSLVGGTDTLTSEWIGGLAALSNGTDGWVDQIGFLTSTSISQANGCYFMYDTQNASTRVAAGGTNLVAECAKGSARKTVVLDGVNACENSFGTSVAVPVTATTFPNTNVWHLRVVLTPSGVAKFYADTSGGTTEVCELTTDFPNTVPFGFGYLHLKNVGTTDQKYLYTDVFRVIDQAATPRN